MSDRISQKNQKEHPFSQFLQEWVPQFAKKNRQLNQLHWILETTGSRDAASLRADLDTELRCLLSSSEIYEQLLHWKNDPDLSDPLLRRQMNVLLRAFQPNQIPQELLGQMAVKEAALSESYAAFRAEWKGKVLSENEIREHLKKESDVPCRIAVWEASKKVGSFLAPKILELVHLRNTAARSLGYPDYFQMQLQLQEVDDRELEKLFTDVAQGSQMAYQTVLSSIEESQSRRFSVARAELGPWAWSDPFCQEDPLDVAELDGWVEGTDSVVACRNFYQRMGMPVDSILAASDLYERAGKSQHAFCIHIDRTADIRTLNNVRPTIKWLETLMHELGHAVYEQGLSPDLPWLLREPPHMIPTEAMALLAGRQAYLGESLALLVGKEASSLTLGATSLQRRQLIFSRWVFVMTAFERELYRDPSQPLNRLWWSFVEKYQQIKAPDRPEGAADWAAKYHIGLAPVYYFSYLLGELFASAIQEAAQAAYGPIPFASPEMGRFLQERLFAPGNRMSWSKLIEKVVGEPLTPRAWLQEFGV